MARLVNYMIFLNKPITAITFLLGGILLMSCGRSTTINETTTFTHIDSLTDTYLLLQDTLLHSWNVVIKDEQEKVDAMEKALQQLVQLPLAEKSQLVSLQSRLEQLKQLQITQKTLANPYVVEEYDFAINSLVAEIIALSESNSVLMQNKNLSTLIEKIKVAEQHTPLFRSGYDSLALLFNAFLEKNESSLKEIDKSDAIEKKPLFSSVAAEK
ncbi:MAG: hypothetical protein ORN54_01180 [Cyclobacteriaceae bacterium]|nr:hypothetical protein [Cyclobacteriaceae bacterium]